MRTTRISLLDRVRDRSDSNAWREFHELYFHLIEGYARARGLGAEDTYDIAADCMGVLVKELPRFQYDRSRGRFRGWLRQIVNRKIIDWQRREKRRKAQPLIAEEVVDDAATPDEIWERRWEQSHLLYCVCKLKEEVSPVQFEAFRLYALEEWPVEQVTRKLGLTPNQVYIAKTRLSARLRGAMLELGEEGQ